MKLAKILQLSLKMLVHSRLRSWLTIIGIFIGVAAVVAIISIGQGLQQSVNSQIRGLGQDIISISAGSTRAFVPGRGVMVSSAVTNIKQLSDKDIQALKLVPGISYINGMVSGRADVKYQTESVSLSVQGSDPAMFKEFVTTSLDSGRYMGQGDVKSIVIGNGIATRVFKNEISVGYVLTINDKPFRVVGILASSGGGGFGGSDETLFMSTKDAREVLGGTLDLAQDEYSSIRVKVADVNFVNETSNAIETALMNSHHVTANKKDFSIFSSLALQQSLSSITGALTLFLGAIAAISLIVGGVGVANTMFTSVLEKTKDIGIMKAIGAKNSDILLLFLFNSGLLGLAGGILGIVFGVAVSLLIPYLGMSLVPEGSGFKTVISPLVLILAALFSIAIGMISGAVPAYNASKLKPVEALRYE